MNPMSNSIFPVGIFNVDLFSNVKNSCSDMLILNAGFDISCLRTAQAVSYQVERCCA